MSDPQREQASAGGEPAGVTRDARIEELLLTGLDHYFGGRHSEAIHVWTRVLFLDRSHARARAYIERARSAIAEGQRESDELLQRGMAAFQDGQAEVARRLLTRAAERAGSQQEEALAVLGRIERLEAAGTPEAARDTRTRTEHPPAPAPAAPGRSLVWFAILVLIAALGTIGILVATRGGRAPAWLALLPSEARDTAPTAPTLLPIPQPGEVAMVRARALYARGHLDDALRALDEVARGDQAAGDAEALRAEIQQVLLDAAGARPRGARVPGATGGAR